MAAAEPEVLIAQHVDAISAGSRRLYQYTYVLGVQQFNGAKNLTVRTNRKWKIIQDGGRRTGSNYSLACRRAISQISTAKPVFFGSSNSMALRTSLCERAGNGIIPLRRGRHLGFFHFRFGRTFFQNIAGPMKYEGIRRNFITITFAT